MSNLCSEILQVIAPPTTYNEDLSYDKIGKDISCNLGSMNIALSMDSATSGRRSRPRSAASTRCRSRATSVRVRSIEDGNDKSHTPSASAR